MTRAFRRVLWVVPLTAFLVLAISTLWAPAPLLGAILQTDPATLYHQHILAINRGDLTAVMADYAPDATFIAPGAGPCAASAPCVGTEAIRSLWQALITNHIQAGIISLQASGNTVTGSLNSISDSQRAAGFGVLRIKVSVTYANDKIVRDVVEYDATDPATANYLNFVRQGAVLRSHYDAVNRGDVAAVLATFTADATMVRGALCPSDSPCVGKAAIQRQLEREPALRVHYSLISARITGDTLLVRSEFTNQNFPEPAGASRAISQSTVLFQGDLIARLIEDFDASDPETATFLNFSRVARVTAAFSDLRSRGDLQGAVARFADDAVFEGWGLCAVNPCAGKAAIEAEIAREIRDNFRGSTVPGTNRVSGDIQTFRSEVRSDSIRAAGIERVLVSATAEVRGERITRLRYELDPSDAQTAVFLQSPRGFPLTGSGGLADQRGLLLEEAAMIALSGLLVALALHRYVTIRAEERRQR